jgi:hypothetical protein
VDEGDAVGKAQGGVPQAIGPGPVELLEQGAYQLSVALTVIGLDFVLEDDALEPEQ